ncbi:uncharacterized protein FSUBG_1333 [Fusarium subglutinans]|uniref:Uncharacterized protein n=1 Tax=Gibberella subglutinans TaxID=42677 RepID=A0A8H5V6N0_GIBSU|nr:uncharacterized protein FSUBG_1333 [Fusarium subglutinans]KAF5612526.1 hypothetical protein FSUBG_1333 [Fusarium subglutinans]
MSTKTKGCSGHSWGFIAPDVQDPPLCISLCRERFLKELVLGGETIERVCEVLQDRDWMEKEQPFRALYCCDAQACGVDNLGQGGKDHPGPPQPYHICDPESLNEDKDCQQAKGTDKSQDASSQTTSRASAAESTLHQTTKPTTLETTSVPIQSSIPETTYSTTTDPSTLATSDPSSSDSNNTNKGMPLGVKVTIAIISVVGLLAIAALIFCLLRRRRSRKTDIRRLIKHPSSPPPRADSPTPLVSPTISHTDPDGVPLTPPARLGERRFLADEPNGFPTSPVYSPTSSKLSPRHERTPRIYSANQVPMIVMTAPDGGKVRDDGSLSFSDGIITPPPSAHIAPLGYNTQTSPPRPPRSRDASFNMLASPGPPPTRALPLTPPYRPSTPTSPPRKGTMPF